MKHLLFLFLFLQIGLFQASAQDNKKPVTTTFWVGGACEMCKARIERIMDTKGVRSSSYDLAKHQLTVTYVPAKISIEQIHALLNDAGHDTEKSKATDAAYENLHGCCKYREHEKHDDDKDGHH